LLLLACGTSFHAGLIGKYIIEELLGIPSRVELGSEFNHRNRLIVPSMTIAITQSGETADILIPLKKLKQIQSKTVVITNVPGSTASRLADHIIYTRAGPEVSVAATKTFTAQLIELYKIVLSSCLINPDLRNTLLLELRHLPSGIQEVLGDDKPLSECAEFLTRYDTVFYVGRGYHYPVALKALSSSKKWPITMPKVTPPVSLKHGPFAL
jgi:glucosamine--fructose-6-phosphate aminotransferase (isomerizing)